MPFNKQRVAITLVATIWLAQCGMVLGYLMGRTIALRLAATDLSLAADQALSDSVAYSQDAHAVLDAMNAASAPWCGKADLEFLNTLFYKSHLLKEIGRVHEGRIRCSTTLGRVQATDPPWPAPDYTGADGVRGYRDLPALRLHEVTVTTLQKMDSYVVLNPYIYSLPQKSLIHLRSTVIDGSQMRTATQRRDDSHPQVPILTRNSDFRIGEELYSTRCSQLYNTCRTATVAIPEVLKEDRLQISGNVALGGVAGALLGFFVALLYRRQRSMEKQLRRAIRQGGLRLAYQPILNLTTQQIVGAEALSRWTDEDDIVVAPDVFVRIAEEAGFVGEITELVVRHALHDFRDILRRDPEFRLNINVTAWDLADEKFLPMLAQALAEEGIAASSLTIEITESSTAKRLVAIEAIRQLRQRGHHVHIDDFGTGYSSLAYLKDLAVDAIKIDKAFTHAIGTNAVTLGILPQILALAKTLQLGVIAEGIETEEQAGYFAGSEETVLGQGWLFGKAVSLEEFQTNLAADQKADADPGIKVSQ
jgi:sensor c-di-GMP phosphodiesterase-like protein